MSVQRKRSSRIMKSSLRRTESYIDVTSPVTLPYTRLDVTIPYTRTLQYYKEQREHRRRATLNRSVRQLTKPVPTLIHPIPIPPPRHTSPLSPSRTALPSRPLFPRSRPEPDLYRTALKTSMKGSPEGQKILRMGPHLAVSMMSATMELERLVASAETDDDDDNDDVLMQDSTTFWASDDWEMV